MVFLRTSPCRHVEAQSHDRVHPLLASGYGYLEILTGPASRLTIATFGEEGEMQ